MESLKNGKCVLESPWKVLDFFGQKRVRTLWLIRPMQGNPDSSSREIFGCGNWNPWNPGKFCLSTLEPWAFESGIQLKEPRIPLRVGSRSQGPHWQRLEFSTWNPESMAGNPESKTVLDSLSLNFIRLLRVVFSSQQRRYWGSNNDSR